MTYSEFREEYKSFLREYPDASCLWEAGKVIELTTIEEEKTGSRWKETGRETELIDLIHYANCVSPDTIRFFKNLGGSERVERSYTKRGYIATQVTSTNPSRDRRTIRRFAFN